MSLILAIEPDPRQATLVRRVVQDRIGGELVLVDSKDAAIAAIEAHVPDLILLTALLSPREEEELVRHLRHLDGADHLQTLTIPQLASSSSDERRGGRRLFGGLTRISRRGTVGCDLGVFAEEIRGYVERAQGLRAERESQTPRVEPEPASPADGPEASAVRIVGTPDAFSDQDRKGETSDESLPQSHTDVARIGFGDETGAAPELEDRQAPVPTAVSLAAAVETARRDPEVEDVSVFPVNVDVRRAVAPPADPITVLADQPHSSLDAPESTAVMTHTEERPVLDEPAVTPKVEIAGFELPLDPVVAEVIDDEPEEAPTAMSAEATAWLFSTIRALHQELRRTRDPQPTPPPPLAQSQALPPSSGSSQSPENVPLEKSPPPPVARERRPAERWQPRPLPFAAWAQKPLGGHAQIAPVLELDALLSLLRVPLAVAMVSYPRGCRIGRVRVPRREKAQPGSGDPIVIVSRQSVRNARRRSGA